MLNDWSDIKDKLGPPSWYDELGVPRYCEFHPRRCGVYIDRCILMGISCQSCDEQFTVAFAWSGTRDFMESMHKGTPYWQSEPREDWIPHYGDPPNHGCVGDTMNCNDLRVLEYWRRDGTSDWTRYEEIEQAMNKKDATV